ncbi:hypothetical protein AMTRI_Chr13g91700 [Amborella trichopoda]|uniref:Cyclin-like domain-containing protein n=1 Tax=Amborella trichopoda TaxID=13333 RepID=U5D644_AMBTC|nr:cyclin-T1-3 [Amborella trichopoda]XP_011627746.1 cyclin-T1-3 [Amborella trichopoda]ERN17710.1 hypothetical protein AMTR_s00059p00215360 [Amborella trichopoda]|eukprot:XP_006856243.1 cyclin-T1-3 [Amborella trichopoda]
MAGVLPGDPSHHGIAESGSYTHDKLEEPDHSSSNWYFGRKEIEENSPSRRDGIDLKKETYFRKSYCTFLQDLGMRLKVPQVTIATAIIFCHRFFLRQSHLKNDRRTIATVCMFLAGKVEETPRPLRDVILVSYEIIHKKDPSAVQRIKQKEVYEQQKELILLGERVVLATLGFDLNVHHPYKPLVEAIKKFKVAQNALAQVAWNFVNDGLRTSLCLQFKPHHIAAGAIFLAAKFLKVKLPSDGEKVWWQEFDVTPRQLEEVSNQMLELYEQNRTAPPPPSHGSEVEGSTGAGGSTAPPTNHQHRPPPPNAQPSTAAATRAPVSGNDELASANGTTTTLPEDHGGDHRLSNYHGNHPQAGGDHRPSRYHGDHSQGGGPHPQREPTEPNSKDERWRVPVPNVIGKIDKDKVKAALEKRRNTPAAPKKSDFVDEDDLIERELENGVEMAAEAEKKTRRGGHFPPESSDDGFLGPGENRKRSRSLDSGNGIGDDGDVLFGGGGNTEEGELSGLDASESVGHGASPVLGHRHGYQHHERERDGIRVSRHHEYGEREQKRHRVENLF